MVCGGNSVNSSGDDNCVCTVLRAIADAQTEVSPTTGPCTVSCERSIQEVLGQVSPATTTPNTVPVILYCGCEPFLGTGVIRVTTGQGQSQVTHLECVQSFVFRVTSVDNNCCAVLELLQTLNEGGNPINTGSDVCSQFGNAAREFARTGICITVDLNCFCGVSCLDAVLLPPATA